MRRPSGSVLQEVLEVARRPEGLSAAEASAAFGWPQSQANARLSVYVVDGWLHKVKRTGHKTRFFAHAEHAAAWAASPPQGAIALADAAPAPDDDERDDPRLQPRQLRTTAQPGQAPAGAVSSVFALAAALPAAAQAPAPLAWSQPLRERVRTLMADGLIRTTSEVIDTLQADRQAVMAALSALKRAGALMSQRTPGHDESVWSLASAPPAGPGAAQAAAHAAHADDVAFRCALYSDGVLWLQLDGGRQLALTPAQTRQLLHYLGALHASRALIEEAAS